MKVNRILLFATLVEFINGSPKNPDCADMHTFIQVSDPVLDPILEQINNNCVAYYFADCSGQLIEMVYKQDGAVLGRELAQGVYQAWYS